MTAAGANRAQARFVTAVGIGSTALLGSVSVRTASGVRRFSVLFESLAGQIRLWTFTHFALRPHAVASLPALAISLQKGAASPTHADPNRRPFRRCRASGSHLHAYFAGASSNRTCSPTLPWSRSLRAHPRAWASTDPRRHLGQATLRRHLGDFVSIDALRASSATRSRGSTPRTPVSYSDGRATCASSMPNVKDEP